MTAVKRMTTTSAFLNMPYENRGCNVELFQDCRTRSLLEACNCVPWEVSESFGTYREYYGLSKALEICNPKGRDCIESNSTQDFNCIDTCVGLHADVDLVEDKVGLISKQNTTKGSGQRRQHLNNMIEEYRTFKNNSVKSFIFNASAKWTHFGM